MVDSEKMNGKYAHSNPIEDIKSTANAFTCDLLELAELQGRLLRADANLALRQSLGSVAAIAVSCCCLVGCLPVLAFGIASAIASYFEIEVWLSQIAVGSSLSVISLLLGLIAIRALRLVGMQFSRSADELSKTLTWTKNTFRAESTR